VFVVEGGGVVLVLVLVVVNVELQLFGGLPALMEFEGGFSGTHFGDGVVVGFVVEKELLVLG
jgi:hypothetical protein